jgi:hypothetical protein
MLHNWIIISLAMIIGSRLTRINEDQNNKEEKFAE